MLVGWLIVVRRSSFRISDVDCVTGPKKQMAFKGPIARWCDCSLTNQGRVGTTLVAHEPRCEHVSIYLIRVGVGVGTCSVAALALSGPSLSSGSWSTVAALLLIDQSLRRSSSIRRGVAPLLVAATLMRSSVATSSGPSGKGSDCLYERGASRPTREPSARPKDDLLKKGRPQEAARRGATSGLPLPIAQ